MLERHFSTRFIQALLPLLGLLVTGSVMVVAGASYMHMERAAGAFFLERLAASDAQEEVRIGSRVYTVSGGRIFVDEREVSAPFQVARLAYAKLLARKAPLLGLPGVDPEELQEGVVALEEIARRASAIQITATERAAVRDDLYPTNFLRRAAELEEARQRFLQSGTWSASRAYDQALVRALGAHAHDLADFSRAFQKTVPEIIGHFAIQRIIISRAHVVSALEALKSGNAQLSRSVASRKRCFQGSIASCESLPESFRAPSDLADPDLVLAGRVRTKLIDAGWSLDGPFIELASSSCVRKRPLFVHSQTAPVYVGDINLLPVEEHKHEPFVSYFAAEGIPYLYSNPFNYYGCLDVLPDYAAVNAVLAVREFAARAKMSAIARGADRDALAGLEQKLASDFLVKESDAQGYIAIASRLHVRAAPELRREVEALELSMRTRSSGLAELIDRIVAYESDALALKEDGVPLDKSAKYFFYVRNGIFSLLLAQSLTPGVEQLFEENVGTRREWPYVWYSELPQSPQLEDDVARSLSFYRRFQEGS